MSFPLFLIVFSTPSLSSSSIFCVVPSIAGGTAGGLDASCRSPRQHINASTPIPTSSRTTPLTPLPLTSPSTSPSRSRSRTSSLVTVIVMVIVTVLPSRCILGTRDIDSRVGTYWKSYKSLSPRRAFPQFFVLGFVTLAAGHCTDHHQNYEYQPPRKGDARSPCSFLNTLANHGYLPRDGKGIDIPTVLDVCQKGFNVAPDVLGTFGKLGLLTSTNFTFLSLDQLNLLAVVTAPILVTVAAVLILVPVPVPIPAPAPIPVPVPARAPTLHVLPVEERGPNTALQLLFIHLDAVIAIPDPLDVHDLPGMSNIVLLLLGRHTLLSLQQQLRHQIQY
ncbi:hypothetical protein D9758_015613 [Tetrapyrgos nigripes]|uniref:Heme haloperoxidase family profile domain-containing protein n=1 Tax=Tetrapyrgos nigripes TaxID=182062 RepID=A0A8H5CKF8_9AGAR|nr:hypothetical protein D9758_015613 [Tetrapyrgos nigripes]